MKVEILDEAQEDLLDGFRFYECQSEGLGDRVGAVLDCRRDPGWIRDRLS